MAQCAKPQAKPAPETKLSDICPECVDGQCPLPAKGKKTTEAGDDTPAAEDDLRQRGGSPTLEEPTEAEE